MVPPDLTAAAFVLAAALVIDRLLGDPRSAYHPVALLGRFIGWWGRPARFRPGLQRAAGVIFWLVTASLFTLTFAIVALCFPWYLYLLAAPFLLKACLAWRALEEHTVAVTEALRDGVGSGREKVRLLVSRDTAQLDPEHIRSAAYESMTENLTDSIVSPLFWYSLLGLAGAAVFRAANTMDAMLGYRDERVRLGWFSARMDDILNYIPARITLLLFLCYFSVKGRGRAAWRIYRRDGRNRPGFNGGIVMAAMAGGTGIRFEKPGVYTIGDAERTLEDGGADIVRAFRAVALSWAILAGSALFLLGTCINSTGI